MGEDRGNGIEESIVNAATSVAVEVYRDAAKPAVSAIGETLGNAARFTTSLLNAIFKGGSAAVDRLVERVSNRGETIPPERRLLLPPGLAAKVALQVALLGDGAEASQLHQLFENLLVASMDSDTATTVHPAFAGMISEMTQDEAWLLKSISRRRYAAVLLFERNSEGALLTQSRLGFRTLLGLDLGIDVPRQQQCLSNLERLGILRIDFADATAPDVEREQLRERIDAEFPGASIVAHGGSISVTPFGEQFLDTCVRTKR